MFRQAVTIIRFFYSKRLRLFYIIRVTPPRELYRTILFRVKKPDDGHSLPIHVVFFWGGGLLYRIRII